MKPLTRACLCGVIWGLLASAVFPFQLGDHVPRGLRFLAGAAAGAPMGILVYFASRWLYRRKGTAGLLLWSIPTMYVSAALWGAMAFGSRLLTGGPMAGWGGPREHLIGGAVIACYGLTVIPRMWAFFVLAAVTHLWMRAQAAEGA